MAISAQFTADFTQYTAAAKGAQEALDGVKGSAAGIGVQVEQQAYRAGQALGDFTGKVKAFATDYISAFAEEEAATQRLTSALQAQGTASTETVAAYERMATQFQNTTRYSDDAVTAAQTALTQIGRIAPEQMAPAIQAAADLAAGLGIGLEEAATKLATVIGTDGAKLGTLKPILGDVEVKGKSAAEILGIINSKFGGAAAADMATSAAQLDAFNNQLDDFKGKAGGALAGALTPFLEVFQALSPAMQSVIAGGTALVAALVPIGLAFGAVVSGISTLVGMLGGAAGLSAAFGAVAAVLTGPVIAAIAAVVAAAAGVYYAFKNWDQIAGFVQGVYTAIKTWLVDRFQALVASIMAPIQTIVAGFKSLYDKVVGHSYVPDLVNGIADQFGRLPDVMTRPAQAAAAETTAAFAAVQAAADDAARAFVSSSFNRMSKNYMTILTDSGGVARDMFGKPVAVDIPGGVNIARSLGQQNIQVTINGSVLSTQDQIAMAMNDAMMRSYRQHGNRQPV